MDDPTAEYMNLFGMIFSMCGLMLKVGSCDELCSTGYAEACWICVFCIHDLLQILTGDAFTMAKKTACFVYLFIEELNSIFKLTVSITSHL